MVRKGDKYQKTKHSREKTIVYCEQDQELNDQRLAKHVEVRSKERERNIAVAMSNTYNGEDDNEDDLGDETPSRSFYKEKEAKEYSTSYVTSTEENDEDDLPKEEKEESSA